MTMGYSTKFTPAIVSAICERLSAGESLRSICRDEGMPSEVTVRRWAMDNTGGFAAQYAQARNLGLDALADEVIEIADTGSSDTQRDRLRFDARRWLLSKLAPKRYGDRQSVEVSGPDGAPIRHVDLSGLSIAELQSIIKAGADVSDD
jgi:hypothetical protein